MHHPLPYTFARTSKLLLEGDGDRLTLSWCDASDRSALSEVARKFAGPSLQMQIVAAAELSQRIHEAYSGGQAHGASTAAAANAADAVAPAAAGFAEVERPPTPSLPLPPRRS